MDYDLTVVMPALNEELAVGDAVENTLKAFAQNSINGEVVVINDGSTDKTPDIVNTLIKKHGDRVVLLNHKTPMGIGKSFFDGVAASRAKGVTMLPGDNENDPNEILRYAGLLKEVDMVVPYVINKNVRSFSRNLLSKLFNMIVNLSFGTSFKYTNGTVIYRKSVLKDIECKSSGFFFQAETLIKASRRKYSYKEVPYKLSQRKGGKSKAVTFSSLKKVIRNYIELLKDVYFRK